MIAKHKIIDIDFAAQKPDVPYIIVFYDQKTSLLTFGGRERHSDHILDIVKNLFFIEDEFISDPKFNQGVNIRFEVKDLDFAIYSETMKRLKDNPMFHVEKINQLKRMM